MFVQSSRHFFQPTIIWDLLVVSFSTWSSTWIRLFFVVVVSWSHGSCSTPLFSQHGLYDTWLCTLYWATFIPPTNFFFIIAYWFPGDNRFSSEGRCCCLQGGSLMICAAYNHRGMDPKLVKLKSLCEAINTEIVERHKRILPEGDSTNRSISE